MDELHFSNYSNYISGPAILAWAAVTVLTVATCLHLARHSRTGTSIWKLLGLVLPFLLILEATLFRETPSFTPSSVLNWSSGGWNRISYNPWSDQVLLNALLFTPAGFAWTFARRRPFAVWLGLTGMSLLIELAQGSTGLGAPDVADMIANSIGAALGAAAAWVVLSLAAVRRGVRPRPRALITRAALLTAAATALFAFLAVGADRRQARLETELVDLYGTSSFEQYARWEKADGLSEEVFDKTSVFSDGTRYGDESVTIRYPASFFGVRRCVFAIWTTGSFAVTRGHGRACTEFIG
jgi:glycopeptide antibiotics resistance protein